jgi:hypothetical protein
MKLHPKIRKPFAGLYSLCYLTPDERIWLGCLIAILTIGAFARWHHLKQPAEPRAQTSEEIR